MRTGIREILLAGVLVGIPVASYFLVFRPQNRDIKAARTEIEHKKGVLDKLRQESARSADLAKSNAEIEERIKQIEARLPSNKEVEQIVRQVADVCTASGLTFPEMKTNKAIKSATFMEQPIELSTEGNFTGFYDFVTKLEQLPRITKMTDLKLRRLPNDNGKLEAKFTLSIFYQDEGAVK